MSDLTGQVVARRYRVDAFIASGGMGTVYKAWDLKRTTTLAIKVLKPQLASNRAFLESFRSEASALAGLQHPNIVRFYGMEQDRDLTFIVMDYVDGDTLRQEILKAARAFPLRRIVEIMRGICSALNYAHELGYVHCDVKPANVILNPNGVPLLSDFGIARLTGMVLSGSERSGTPGYMAPELIRGGQPTRAADIYSLGVLLFEMLTGGARPYSGKHAAISGSTGERIRWEQLHLPPPSLRRYHPGISRDLEAIVRKCLAREPRRRYQTVLQLLGALEAVLRQGFPAERPDEIPPSVKLPVPGGRQEEGHGDLRRAKRIRAYWVAVIILVSLLALFLLSTSGGPTSRAASTSAWNAFRSSSLGFSIEYPAGWVYEVDEGNSQVIFASSSRALQAQGALDSGAAMVVLRIALAQDDFPDSVDAHLPESLLPYFVEYYLGDAYRKESLRKLRVNSYPAATAVYATGRDELDVDQMYHWTVVMDGEMATMMIGLTPEESWYSYKPVFEGMRDSLVP